MNKMRKGALFHVKGFMTGLWRLSVLKFGPAGVEVDINDDSLDRWYVKHNKFDPERNQVRHVFLKAFSNQKAQMKYFAEISDPLEARKLLGEVPKYEHIIGGHYARGITPKFARIEN
jgi:hypothetical protein